MTLRLIHNASERWAELDGMMASRGEDTLSLPMDRFLNLVYWWLIQDATAQEIERFNIRLWMPPPGVVATQGPWTAEAETAAFKGLKASLDTNRSKA